MDEELLYYKYVGLITPTSLEMETVELVTPKTVNPQENQRRIRYLVIRYQSHTKNKQIAFTETKKYIATWQKNRS